MVRAFLIWAILAGPALAVQPDEVLDDPELEARARALSRELRCVVCQGESIDDSNAEIARDLRLLVRERLVAGDSDEEALDQIVGRYGEYVLFRPPMTLGNAALWLAGPVLLLAGGAIAFAFVRRRGAAEEARPDPLSEAEAARLRDILRD